MPQLFKNNARALLASGILAGATSLTVEAGKADLFPTANTGTGSVPGPADWFKLVLQDSLGNVEIMYVRTRTAGSAILSNIIRGQEGTTARSWDAGSVCGLRITAVDIESSISAGVNAVQLAGNQAIGGIKTFNETIVGSISGDAGGNAGSVTNGVYTVGDQSIAGIKSFTTAGGLRANAARMTRQDTAAEGGELSFERASDGAIHYYMDTNGSGGTPSWRLVNSPRAAASLTLDNSGNLTVEANVTAFSDERLKTDWAELPGLVEDIAGVKMGTYTRTDTGDRQVGVSAQSLQGVLPEAVMQGANPGDMLSVAYGNAALAACVALAREVVQLRERLAALEAK